MELRDYLRILYANWVLILILTFLGVATGAIASIVTQPQYEASTKLYVSVESDSEQLGDRLQGSNLARQSMATFSEIVKTESVLQPVADSMNLDLTARQLASKITTSTPLNSSLLNITVKSTDPVEAAQLANEVGAKLKKFVQEDLEPPRGEQLVSPINITAVQTAQVPENPVTPRIKMNLALGALVGLALGLGIAVLRSVLDTRIRSLHDIEQITDAPLLGGITDDPDVTCTHFLGPT